MKKERGLRRALESMIGVATDEKSMSPHRVRPEPQGEAKGPARLAGDSENYGLAAVKTMQRKRLPSIGHTGGHDGGSGGWWFWPRRHHQPVFCPGRSRKRLA